MSTAKEQTALGWLHGECVRLQSRECRTRRCLVRGGYCGKGPVDTDIATCEAKEAADVIEAGVMLADLYRKSLDVGPLTTSPAREARFWRLFRDRLTKATTP